MEIERSGMRRTSGIGPTSWTVSATLALLMTLAACGPQHGDAPGPSAPEPRSSAALAYDVHTGQLVLFGGAAERSLGDTWVWHGNAWQQLRPSSSPPARENAALAYDAAAQQLVLFGGDSVDATGQAAGRTDTWTWDGATWTERHPQHHPQSGVTPRMAYDQARGVLLLVTQPCQCGGKAPPDSLAPVQTWTWRHGDWHAEAADGAPLAAVPAVGGRTGLAEDGVARPAWGGPDFAGSAGIGWDPVSRAVLYVEHVVEADAPLPLAGLVTWSWDGAWRLDHPQQAPGDAPEPLLASDGAGTLLYDGSGRTWRWDGRTWASTGAPGPAERGAAAIAYDSGAHVVRLFGGIAAAPGGVYGDTWTWNGNAWSRSAGPALAQPVPQPQATKPASGISRDRAVAIARKAFPEQGGVTRVENGPLGRFQATSVGAVSQRVWVWAVVFGNASVTGSCGPARPNPTCPPPARGLVALIDYRTGRVIEGTSPAPDWLLPTPTPTPA